MLHLSFLARGSLCRQPVLVTAVLFYCCSLLVHLASASPLLCSPETHRPSSLSYPIAFQHGSEFLLTRSDRNPHIQTLKPRSAVKHSTFSITARRSKRSAVMMCDDPSSGLGDAAAKLSVLSIPLEPSADLSVRSPLSIQPVTAPASQRA